MKTKRSDSFRQAWISTTKRFPSKQEFESYERVRKSRKFDMIMQSERAAKAADLSSEVYWSVIKHYKTLKENYGTDLASS